MLALVVEGRVPAGSPRAVFSSPPRSLRWARMIFLHAAAVVEAQTRRVLPLEREDVRPHVSGVLLQFLHRFFQRHAVAVAEQTVGTQPLRPGPGGDILQILLRLTERVPVGFQCQREEGEAAALVGLAW